ncbi:MAG: F0F1 ATP synthase subunit delta [Candidatus Competibacteraceae bacterium]|jgi:F-type H+-transporting ATPase subunit delta|nr:F0F1 ATP synthase subunit delta [Candidatus Competibacteraceae bacterium]MCB1804997.1 F0F1 ATP synthase subunit delta [Candidatus Competibacteraceae bacterium]MCB1813121.1 F0F1 ATP synthase subunit delta [Candidatus Competibacteraceae bacterium]
MAELTTIARPYARAAFEIAQGEEGGLQRWSEMLQFVATVVQDKTIQAVLSSPDHDSRYKAGLLLKVCADQLSPTGSNFIKLLAENHRLNVLPDIVEVYEELRAEVEKTVEAEVTSAFELTEQQRQQLAKALSQRLQREVVLHCTIDQSLLGGAIIRAGDLVIDGSAQGRLAKLGARLSQ